ncbi:MAG: hypothetical protein JWR38_5300 [Mucilaginibacter sp.]|nr:hypothetical protein [Mucilaginibacter sp.]
MKIEYVEGLLVCIIVFFQFRSFYRTYQKINLYQQALPPGPELRMSRFKIDPEKLEALDPATILDQLTSQSGSLIEPDYNAEQLELLPDTDIVRAPEIRRDQVTLSIIESRSIATGVFKTVKQSINTYLIRNHGAAADFHLVKDIVERNIGALEEEINLSISIPLYLGLMGTMMGIVIGLFNIPDLGLVLDNGAKDAQLNMGIALLIGGVKVAMISSFTGLLLTIVNSGYVFKGSRTKVEANKNNFYTFVQTELLPVLNQSLGFTLVSLQRNLQLFNQDFTGNLDRLSGIFQTNYEAISAQDRVLTKLEKIDISQIANFNITVLRELQHSIKEFEQFNSYLKNMNAFVDSSQQLASRADALLARTGNFEDIALNLQGRLDQSQALLDFLSRHFQQLESHKNLVNGAVADVGHAISGTFGDLREHIQTSTDMVRQFTVDEIDALKTALSESRTNLSNLSFLADLNKDVAQFKSSSATQGDRIGLLVGELNTNLKNSVQLLEKIQQGSLTQRLRSLFIKEKH